MPTAVEFQHDASYADKIMASRGVTPDIAKRIVAIGRGSPMGGGRTVFTDDWTHPTGQRWSVFVVTQGGRIIDGWAEQG